MARSVFTESQVVDADFLSEEEHENTDHYFRDLADTTTYSGQGGKYLRAKEDNTGLEYVSAVEGDVTWSEKTSYYLASDKDHLILNTLSGGFVIGLPSSPSVGDYVSFVDGEGYCGTNSVTVSSTTDESIMEDSSGLLEIDVDHAAFDLIYLSENDGWIVK